MGSGLYGDWIQRELDSRHVQTPVPRPAEPNGCCYCLVESGGERTFMSLHGAEYRFRSEWFDLLGDEVFDGVYLCGLEVEEETGEVILDYLEKHPPKTLYFAPGPRVVRIRPEKMARIMALHPVLHLNEAEALMFTRSPSAQEAAVLIGSLTGSPVIITQGERGALALENGRCLQVDGYRAQPADTIGAGDAHIGAVMAELAAGRSMEEAVRRANLLSACVVSVPGATVSRDAWNTWRMTEGQE